MEESDKDRRSTELDEFDHFPIEGAILRDGPLPATERNREVDQCALEIREKASEDVTEKTRECDESERIPQQKVEQCEDTMQNVSVELSGAEYQRVDECPKERAIECAEKSDDAASEERSGPSKTKELCTIEKFGVSLENVMDNVPIVSTRRSLGDEEIAACMAREQDVPEIVELGLEGVEQPKYKLLVQQAQQMVELVSEEAVICDGRPLMEEARDIEEPQKYAFKGKEDDNDD